MSFSRLSLPGTLTRHHQRNKFRELVGLEVQCKAGTPCRSGFHFSSHREPDFITTSSPSDCTHSPDSILLAAAGGSAGCRASTPSIGYGQGLSVCLSVVLPIKQLDNLLDFIEFQSIRHEEEAEVEYATHQEYATPPVAQFNASLCRLIERDETVFRRSD